MKDIKKKKKKGSKKSRKKRIETGSVSKTEAISTHEDRDKKKVDKLAVKKTPEAKTRKKSSGTNFISLSIQFYRDAKTELFKKVKFPTKKELMAATVMVIVLVLIVALYLGVIDFGLIKLLEYIL